MKNRLRQVLVVAYYFPPMGLSGVQRTLKFVKYLPEYGWHPTVLTVDPLGYPAVDETLLEDLRGKNIEIVRTRAAGPGRVFARRETVRLPSETRRKMMSRISDTFFIPDNKIGWRRRAVEQATLIHRKTPFDLIFATAPPFTDFLIGADLKARTGKPLVIDYRDPWLDYPFKFYPTPLHRFLNRRMEQKALRASSHVITTNRTVKELIIERYPFLTHHDVDIVPQGYDAEDIERASRNGSLASTGARDRKVMRITYAGVFWEDRRPDHFLTALRDLFEEEPSLRGRIEARFIGTFRDHNLKLVERLGLQDSVRVLDYLPHLACIRELQESDVLWMVVGDSVGSPGKAYEYIGTRKPILGLVPEGFMKTTILEAGGKTVSPGDIPGIKHATREFFRDFESGNLRGPGEEVVMKYDRRSLTGAVVKIFESLVEH